MSLVYVSANNSATISQSGSDAVTFAGPGTLEITGTAGPPIDVTLGQVIGIGLADTIVISNATVHVGGAVGVSALNSYAIGTGATLDITTSVGLAAGSTYAFTGQTGRLTVEPGVDLALASSIGGFSPGQSIDLRGLQVASVAYADAAGSNSGGTLTLLSANNSVLGTLHLRDGDLTTPNFDVRSDGAGGSLISFASAVTGVVVTPANALLGLGGTATLTLSMSNPVAITGSPKLLLDDGGTATYDSAASTPTQLAFTYVVGAGQNTSDLQVTGIDLTGATASSVGGGYVNFTGAVTNPAGTLAVDTVTPVVTSVALSQSNGVLGAGNTVQLSFTIDKPLVVSGGTPTLALNSGGMATFDSAASSGTNLVFDYTVQPGDNTPDLAVTALNLNGATVADLAGNALDPASLAVNPAGILQVDTTGPMLSTLTTSPGNGVVGVGSTVVFTAALSEGVTLSGGAPSLQLDDGGIATYDSAASTPTQLVFRTTIAAGQNTADLAVTAVNANGASSVDAAGVALDLNSLAINPAGILAVDTAAPIVLTVSTNPGSGTLGVGQQVQLQVAVSEAVTVSGNAPTLILSDGGTATLDATNSTPTMLVFDHTVLAGQNTADLAITGVNVAGTTIADDAANLLDLSAAIGNPAGVLTVDTTPSSPPSNGPTPFITNVSTMPGSGMLVPGDTVAVVLAIDHAVAVSGGTPTLALSDGGLATFDPTGSTPTSLVFSSVVQPGQSTSDLEIVGYDMNGATIEDANGSALSLTGAEVNPPGVLAVGPMSSPTTSTGSGAPPASDDTSATGSTASASIPIYRFFESTNGTHFYTASATERDQIEATRPDLIPEGVGLRAVDPASGDPNAIAVYRFFDTIHGTQFLTASASERDNVLATRPDLKFEPEGTFYEHTQPQADDTAVYRFFSSSDGTHFYTDSAVERASILQTRPDLIAEGIGFYEPKAT